MIGSTTVSLMTGAIIDGSTQAFVDYQQVFLLIGGIILAFGIIEYLAYILRAPGDRDTIDDNR
jgi:flagellar motor component MotA